MLLMLLVADVVVDNELEAGDEDEDGHEGEAEDKVEAVFGRRPQTEHRSTGWNCHFDPTTPDALQRHCCYLHEHH